MFDVDVLLESLRIFTMIGLVLVLIGVGRRYPTLVEGNWRLILVGFSITAVAFSFDLADEFINVPVLELPLSLGEALGSAAGLLVAAVGFGRWFNFMGRFLGAARA